LTSEKVLFSWSGGKESALSLYKILESGKYEVLALLVTVTEDYGRVSMHGVRFPLIKKQAEAMGLNLEKVAISKDSSNEEYEAKMRDLLTKYRRMGVSSVVFGDVYLEDVRKRRENNLSKVGIKGIFPLWKEDTKKLAQEFIKLGFKAIVTCVDSRILNKSFVGKQFNEHFLAKLPSNVDPCGENGEFHSFVFDGPIFKKKVEYRVGETVLRDSFYFCDLLPV